MKYLEMTLDEIFKQHKIPEHEAAQCMKSLEIETPEDLVAFDTTQAWADGGITKVGARYKLVRVAKSIANELKDQQESEAAPVSQPAPAATQPQTISIDDFLGKDIAELENDEELLAGLRQQGVLQFDRLTYLAAIKVLVAAKYGVYEGIINLQKLLLSYALKTKRPAPSEYYSLKELEIRRQLGHVFAIVKDSRFEYGGGIPVYATNAEAQNLIEKIDGIIVPALVDAKNEVAQWYEVLSRQSQDDFFVRQNMGARSDNVIDLQSYPKTDGILEAGKKLRLAINEALAGDEMPHAIALYQEYKDFVKILDTPDLPAHIGAVDRDNVLNLLGFDAKSALLRSEGYLVRFMVCMVQVEELSKQNEGTFFQLIYNLVQQVDWEAVLSMPQKNTTSTDQEIYECETTSRQETLRRGYDGPSQGTLTMAAAQAVAMQAETYPGLTHLNGSAVSVPAQRS